MYDILIKNDNSVVVLKSQLQIVQHSNMVDKLRILVKKEYNEEYTDMSEFTAVMEYLLPRSKKYKLEILDPIVEEEVSNSGAEPEKYDKYADYVKYTLDINSELTTEDGDVEIQFTFVKKTTDNYGGDEKDLIRKTNKAKLTIVPISDWAEARIDRFDEELDKKIPPIPSA